MNNTGSHHNLTSDRDQFHTRTPDEDFVAAERARHIGTEFHLNSVFVESIGHERAELFVETLRQVGARCTHHTRDEVHQVLARALDDIDVRISDVELDSFADEISRSNAVTVHTD
ncbi:MAG: hypothetical protein Q4G51_07390 [Dermatophilus congolensis]|nr:hypothetical protein [Dermatophilus congolensis]